MNVNHLKQSDMKVLISDDNLEFCETIADIIESLGYETVKIQNPEETLEYVDFNRRKIGVMLLDIEFGPDAKLNGLDVLERCRHDYPELPIVMVTGKGTIDAAVKATKLGAINFIEKGILNKNKIKESLESAAERRGAEGEEKEIRNFLASQGIIAKSKVMLDIGDLIVRFGRTDLNVLITGETGTGKKLAAKAIHAISRRAKQPFVTVDIPNIPRDLFQSELFGHVKGSFSGAIDTKKGLFHKADKGTLFLDEIGDLSLPLQSNLLIPIEEKIIRKVGSTDDEPIDVRFLTASDRDLVGDMKKSKFREQLYHRLRECEIHLPPLKDRKEDIPLIVEYYAKKHNEEFNQAKYFAPAAIEFMQEQDWSGNVRELSSVIKVAMQTARNEQIEIADIYKIIVDQRGAGGKSAANISLDKTLKEDLASVDKKKIESVLESCKGNVTKSAARLGVSRETLHNKIRKYDINVQLFRMKGRKKK